MSLRITQVDSFTDRPFAGNPAAVCILPKPAERAWMLDVAREMNLAETAFLVPQRDGYDLRWFTPVIEVDLCGHATLASAHVLWEDGLLIPDAQARFHTKSGLLTALWNLLLRGADDGIAVHDRDWYREVLDEPDPARQLRLNARNSRAVKERVGAVMAVIRSAAPLDPEIDALWDRIQSQFHENQAEIVRGLEAKGALRPGLDVARAADILWTLNHPDVWLLLVRNRGWTPAAYEEWFGDAACAQLLAGAAVRPA